MQKIHQKPKIKKNPAKSEFQLKAAGNQFSHQQPKYQKTSAKSSNQLQEIKFRKFGLLINHVSQCRENLAFL